MKAKWEVCKDSLGYTWTVSVQDPRGEWLEMQEGWGLTVKWASRTARRVGRYWADEGAKPAPVASGVVDA